jgi:hypothetical protein
LLYPSELQGRALCTSKSGPSLRSGFRQLAPGFASLRLTPAHRLNLGGGCSVHLSYRDALLLCHSRRAQEHEAIEVAEPVIRSSRFEDCRSNWMPVSGVPAPTRISLLMTQFYRLLTARTLTTRYCCPSTTRATASMLSAWAVGSERLRARFNVITASTCAAASLTS